MLPGRVVEQQQGQGSQVKPFCGSVSKEPVANTFLRLLPRFLIELFQEHEDASCADFLEI